MQDGMQYDPLGIQGQGYEPFIQSWKSFHFKCYVYRHLQCELAADN